ncbi:MAG: TlpA disulfide reductase family protein [bacterium]
MRTFLMAVTCLVGCGGGGPSGIPPPVSGPDGRPAETVDFTLATLEGEPVQISRLRPRVVLINYFATWAPPSLEDLPALSALSDELPELAVVAVSMDLSPADLLPPFLQVVPVTFPVVVADEATRQGYTPFGRVTAVPTSYLLDTRGRFVEVFHGTTPIDHLRRRVIELSEEAR